MSFSRRCTSNEGVLDLVHRRMKNLDFCRERINCREQIIYSTKEKFYNKWKSATERVVKSDQERMDDHFNRYSGSFA